MNEQQNNESSPKPVITGNLDGAQQISIPVTNASVLNRRRGPMFILMR